MRRWLRAKAVITVRMARGWLRAPVVITVRMALLLALVVGCAISGLYLLSLNTIHDIGVERGRAIKKEADARAAGDALTRRIAALETPSGTEIDKRILIGLERCVRSRRCLHVFRVVGRGAGVALVPTPSSGATLILPPPSGTTNPQQGGRRPSTPPPRPTGSRPPNPGSPPRPSPVTPPQPPPASPSPFPIPLPSPPRLPCLPPVPRLPQVCLPAKS